MSALLPMFLRHVCYKTRGLGNPHARLRPTRTQRPEELQ
jgi:hypothetical protein